MLLNTVDIRYLEYPPSQILTILNFLFGPFSIPFNFPYKSGISNSAISNFHFFLVPSVIFGLFPIHYLKHSNEAF